MADLPISEFGAPMSVREQAALWVSRKSSGEFTASDQRALDAWLAESPEHQTAFDSLWTTWEQTSVAQDALEAEADAILATSAPQQPPFRRSRGAQITAMAATVVLAVLTGIMLLQESSNDVIVYQTMAEETLKVDLDDGSTVQINASSQIEVAYGDNSRDVALVEGEAYFTVMPDSERPFEVTVRDAKFQAVGTAFNLERTSQATTLVVVEGTVAVSAKGQAITRVAEDMSLRVSALGSIGNPIPQRGGDKPAWLNDRFVFDETRLSNVVEDLNRFYAIPIILKGPQLKTRPFSGIFSRKNQQLILQAMTTRYPDIAIATSDDQIELSAP